MDKRTASRVAIIGGGWAGCAAAVTLSQLGYSVTLFEAGRTLGGRARRVTVNHHIVDNGQHILLGAYQHTLQLMKEVGIHCNEVLHTVPLQFRYPNRQGIDFLVQKIPAPFHLLWALVRASGMSLMDKLALIRFAVYARRIHWKLNQDDSVQNVLKKNNQTDRVIKFLWRPLCIAALNTPPERASAQIFLNVLRDSLGSTRQASNMLIPRINLTDLFPDQAAKIILHHQGVIHFGATVRQILPSVEDPTMWEVTSDHHSSVFQSVIIATQANQAAQLLRTLPNSSDTEETIAQLERMTYEPITTCYLQYPTHIRLSSAMIALMDSPEHAYWGQFVFDRSYLNANEAGLLTVVISASSPVLEIDRSTLCQQVAQQLADVFCHPELSTPHWSTVISEKRATFSCQPNMQRPEQVTGDQGILLAGDYTVKEYPATLESAVRSGIQAAHWILNSFTKR